MATPSDLLARQLADEFEQRAKPVAVFDSSARAALIDEFRTRLGASKDPVQLVQKWRKRADHYINLAVDRNQMQIRPTQITDDIVSQQFEACSEFCPTPEKPQLRMR